MTLRRPALPLFAVSVVLAAFFYWSFFANFATTLSDWSGFGFTWTHQMFHNFLHGRPFQSSLFSTVETGESVGFVFNPHAFIHADVIHVNFTPYAFALLWSLRQTPAAIYALIFAWNLAAGGWLTRSILRRGAGPDSQEKVWLAWAVLGFGGLLSVLCQMGQLLLFAGPFMLGAYEAFLSRRKLAFVAWIAALALVSEDAAMVAAAFGAYFFLCEKEGRSYAIAATAVSVPYLLLLLFVVQPAARAELTLSAATTTSLVVGKLFHMTGGALVANLRSMLPLATFVPAFALAAGMFGVPDRRGLVRAAGLAVIPALPHLGECVAVGGGHHLLPPWYALFLGLLSWLKDARGPAPRLAARATAFSAAAFLLFSLRVQAGHLPLSVRPALLRLARRADKAASIERALDGAARSNQAVLAAAETFPRENSLVFLVNNSLEGFLVGRSEVWEFPAHFSEADDVLIQKDAIDANFTFAPRPGAGLESVFRSTPKLNERDQAVTPAMVEAVRSELTAGGLYRIAREDTHVLLLERRERHPFFNPPTTRGWGWTSLIGRKAARAAAL
jgi:hypothetical protein